MSNNQKVDVKKFRMCAEHYPKVENDKLKTLYKSSNTPQHFAKLKAAFVNSKIWPVNSNIKIAFYPRTTDIRFNTSRDTKKIGGVEIPVDPIQLTMENNKLSVEESIRLIVRERIKPLVNLNFEFVSMNENPNIRISFDPTGGAWSYIGTDHNIEKTGPTMNFGWYDAQTIIHEFGHLLGMIHEHQNPFGKPIEWDLPVLYEWASTTQRWNKEQTDTNIVNHYDQNLINGSQFDPLSIMLYFFPPEITKNKKGTSLNPRLSGFDAKWIANIYKKDDKVADEFYQKNYSMSLVEALKLSDPGTTLTPTPSLSSTFPPSVNTFPPSVNTSPPTITKKDEDVINDIISKKLEDKYTNALFFVIKIVFLIFLLVLIIAMIKLLISFILCSIKCMRQ
jgi:serralysin